jgi:hypothetical protein
MHLTKKRSRVEQQCFSLRRVCGGAICQSSSALPLIRCFTCCKQTAHHEWRAIKDPHQEGPLHASTGRGLVCLVGIELTIVWRDNACPASRTRGWHSRSARQQRSVVHVATMFYLNLNARILHSCIPASPSSARALMNRTAGVFLVATMFYLNLNARILHSCIREDSRGVPSGDNVLFESQRSNSAFMHSRESITCMRSDEQDSRGVPSGVEEPAWRR